MSSFRFNRRQILGAAGVSAGALVLYRLGTDTGGFPGSKPGPGDIAGELDSLLASPRWSHAIGEQYLQLMGDADADESSLRAQLTVVLTASDGEAIEERAANAIAADYRNEDLCELDGWSLSVTECRMGALALLAGIYPDENALAQQAMILELENWGPRSVAAGESFNTQPNGNSALWLKFKSIERGGYVIRFGDYEMITSVHPDRDLITADLPPKQSVLATARGGEIPIMLVDPASGREQQLGIFSVDGQLSDADLDAKSPELEVLNWGPRKTAIGRGFNLQPDGSSAFWVQTGATHRRRGSYELMLGDLPMRTTSREKAITASIPADLVSDVVGQAGSIPLVLVDKEREIRIVVGDFVVE